MTESNTDDLRQILQAILERLDKIEATMKLLGPIPPAPYYPMIYPIPYPYPPPVCPFPTITWQVTHPEITTTTSTSSYNIQTHPTTTVS